MFLYRSHVTRFILSGVMLGALTVSMLPVWSQELPLPLKDLLAQRQTQQHAAPSVNSGEATSPQPALTHPFGEASPSGQPTQEKTTPQPPVNSPDTIIEEVTSPASLPMQDAASVQAAKPMSAPANNSAVNPAQLPVGSTAPVTPVGSESTPAVLTEAAPEDLTQPRLPEWTDVSPQLPPGRVVTTREAAKTIVMPAETVINVSLSTQLDSRKNERGDDIQAVVTDPVYIGPYLTIPEGSVISGKVVDVNKHAVNKGPNPYIIVSFNELHRENDDYTLPFNATLVAYKTGLQRKDYVWRLPTKHGKLRGRLSSAFEGAMYGLMVNPIYGAPIGAGAGFLKAYLVDKVAERGAVKISPKDEVPISVQQEMSLPVVMSAASIPVD